MKRQLTCVVCPNGCDIEIEIGESGEILSLTGATCPRGEAYARQEIIAPSRTISSSVLLVGGVMPLASVRLDRPVPRDRIMDVMAEIRACTLQAPVHIGDIAIRNVLGLGSNVIVTREIAAL